jgi:hypothetical protein
MRTKVFISAMRTVFITSSCIGIKVCDYHKPFTIARSFAGRAVVLSLIAGNTSLIAIDTKIN